MFKKRIIVSYFVVYLIAIILVSCTSLCQKAHQQMSPEEVVEAYLNVAFNMTDTKQKVYLIKYTTGPLKEAIQRVSDEVIFKAYIEKKYKLQSYSVIERKDKTPRETEITFKLVYQVLQPQDNLTRSESLPLITTENTVAVVRENNLWLIRNVLNKKSAIDFPLAMAAEVKGDGNIDSYYQQKEIPEEPPEIFNNELNEQIESLEE